MPKAMKAISWTCPQCNQIQYEDLTRCSCGYDHVNAQKNKRVFTVQFSGSSHEYFRIWIVNLCLTLFTFGIYSAWAKVRKKRYFYSHTTVDGTPFQYLGQPIPILKGRVIAASAFVIYYISTHFFTFLLPYIFVIGAVAAPWVLIRSASFNARYSAFRNMTFHFNGTYLDALKTLYAWGVIPAFVLGMMFHWWGKAVIAGVIIFIFGISFPWWIRQVRNFLITHNSFGNKKGFFAATGGQFFAIYFKSSLIMAGIGIVIGFIAVPFATVLFEKKSLLFTWLLMLPLYTGYVIGYAYVQAHSSNLVWNHTRLGPLSFESTLSGWGMTKLYLTNALAIIATLGLLTPWAVMRTLKYRADHMKILQEGKLIEFQGSDMAAVEATGAETVDFFDMDLSL
ncbi:MAG TPA: YjgN family protein [Nitrospirota bacterium]|nr:YjgN family protein [Nitrospirota bacterium]